MYTYTFENKQYIKTHDRLLHQGRKYIIMKYQKLFFVYMIICYIIMNNIPGVYASDWCKNKEINGKFTLSEDCGVHKLSGECTPNGDHHSTAICLFHNDVLEIQGIVKGDNEGNLPQIYRQDHTRSYRLFTVYGWAQLTLRHIGLKFGNVTAVGANAAGHIGSGGAIYAKHSNVFLYNSVLSSNVASGVGGGAAYIGQESKFTAYKTLFFKNHAAINTRLPNGGLGGAVYCDRAKTCSFKSSDIIENTAEKMGGAIYCGKSSICNVSAGTIVSQNVAPEAPGIFVNTIKRAYLLPLDGTSYINSPHCMPGTIGNIVSGTKMTKKNMMTQEKNSGVCTECPQGTYTQDAKTCKNCETGKFTNDIGTACTNITVKKHHHRNGRNSNGHGNTYDDGTVIGDLENPSNFWHNVLYGVGALISLFLVYKICLFIWLKCSGRLNPEMAGWKAFLFTILYGSSLDAHMLPKEDKGVALNSINGNEQSLLYQNLENNEGDEL
jgi:predicted outer membrane repeat protein